MNTGGILCLVAWRRLYWDAWRSRCTGPRRSSLTIGRPRLITGGGLGLVSKRRWLGLINHDSRPQCRCRASGPSVDHRGIIGSRRSIVVRGQPLSKPLGCSRKICTRHPSDLFLLDLKGEMGGSNSAYHPHLLPGSGSPRFVLQLFESRRRNDMEGTVLFRDLFPPVLGSPETLARMLQEKGINQSKDEPTHRLYKSLSVELEGRKSVAIADIVVR